MNPKPAALSRAVRLLAWLAGIFVLLPFIYLASLALLLSAYVHGWSMPSRAFLRAYAVPSNVLAATPGAGRLYSSYFQFCVRVAKADYDPQNQ